MKTFDPKQHPHRRFNPLTREWILVSPQRTQRPWQGQTEDSTAPSRPPYDAGCYLCPGNERAGGARNPAYTDTFVFENDFAALQSDTPPGSEEREGLIVSRAEKGICRVVCFSPRHDLDLSRMEPCQARRVVDVWVEQYRELGSVPWIRSVQIFENRGQMMGASNPHPHCQIWSNASLPHESRKELAALRSWRKRHGNCLLCRCLEVERDCGDRVVLENGGFTALVPYWAVWPFETLVIARRHLSAMDDLGDRERDFLADILRRLTARYDALFGVPFPYSMGFHQRPTDGRDYPEFHFHAHYYPPLLRSATVRKYMVGYELLANPQRDITPESAAERLRAVRSLGSACRFGS